MVDSYTLMHFVKDLGIVAAAGVCWYLFLTGAIVTMSKIIRRDHL